jgi:hypothetical protein
MTVDELRESIADLPGDLLVVMSSDAEGNRHSPLAEVEPDTRYSAETEYSGTTHHPDDWPDYPEAVRVVCLWPTN